MASFETIQNEVIARLGNRTDIGARTAIWINDAMYELAHNPRYSFRELDTTSAFLTTAGQQMYALDILLGASYWFTLSVTHIDTNGVMRVLDQVHIDAIDRQQTLTTETGIPSEYALFGFDLFLYPTPNVTGDAIRVRNRVRLDILSAGQTFPLGREWEEPVTVLAVAKGLEALQRFEEAAGYRGQVLEPLMGTRQSHLELEEPQYETTIGVSFDRWS